MEDAGSANSANKMKDQEAEDSEEEVWDDSDVDEDEEEDDDDTIARIRRAHFAQAAAMSARRRSAPRARPMSQKRKMEAVKNFHDFTKKLKKDTGISIRSLVGNNVLDLSDYSSEDSKSDSDGLSDEEFVVNPSAVQELNEENESYIDPETGDFVEAKKKTVVKKPDPSKADTEKAEVPKTLSISDIINEGDLDLTKNVEISEVEGSELCPDKTAEELLDLKQEETSQDFDLTEKLKEMGEISVKPIDKTEEGGENVPQEIEEKKPETEEEKKLNANTINVRRNIREVMDEKNLDASTLTAQRQESERLARVQEQQRIIREVQRQIALNRQNKIHQKTLSLLQGGSSILKKSAPGQKVNLSNTVTMKLPSGEIKRTILKSGSGVDVTKLPKPTTSAAGQKPIKSEQKKEVVEIVDSSSGEETSSSSSDSDDCIMLSDSEVPPSPEAEDDPHNSGLHVNDAYNIPDEQGRVQINIGHPENEEDIFLAPQIARIIKPHQIGGVRFLFDNIIESTERFSTSTGFGCILAHSMGLGKTLQIVCFTDIFLRHTSSKTVLCIMPINTLQNWVAEFNMWLPLDGTNSPLAAHGEVRPRNFPIYVLNDSHKTLQMRAKVVKDWKTTGGVLMIGYELYRLLSMKKDKKPRKKKKAELKLEEKEKEEREKKKEDKGDGVNDDTQGSDATQSKGLEDKPSDDDPNKMDEAKDEKKEDSPVDEDKRLLDEMYEALVKPGPDLVICDEGHRIKNSHSNISYALKQMRTKRRVVLTGYPLQNNLLEYWCMVDFVRPNYLGSKTEFCNMFERPIQNGQCIDSTPQDIRLMRYRAHVLHSLLVGFVQRRSHAVLQSTLPQKEEYVLLVRMTPLQRKLYERFMNEVVRSTSVPNPLKAFAICCKIWNHPDVLYNFLKKRSEVNAAIEEDLDLEEIGGVTKAGRNKNGKTPAKRGPKPRAAKKPAATIPPNTSGPPRPDALNNQQQPPSGPYPPNYRPDQQGPYPPYPNFQNPGQYYPPNQPFNQNYDNNYYQQQPPYGNNFPNQQQSTPYPQNNPEGQGYNQNYWNNGGQYYDNSGYYNNQQQYPNQPGQNYNDPAAPNYQENSSAPNYSNSSAAPPNYQASQPGNFQATPPAPNFPNAQAPGFQGAPSAVPNYPNPSPNYQGNPPASNYQGATPAPGDFNNPQQYPPNYTAPTDPAYVGNAVQPYANNQNVPNQQRPFEGYNNPQNYPTEYNSNTPATYPNNQSQYPNHNYPQGYPSNAPYDTNAPAPYNQYNQPPNYPGYGNMPAALPNQQAIKNEPNTNYPTSEVKTEPESQSATYNVPYNYTQPNTSTYQDRPENSNGNCNQYPQYPSPLETKPPLNSGSSGSPITSWPITEIKTEVDRFKVEEKLEIKSESDGEVKIEDLDTKTIVKDEKAPKKEVIAPKEPEAKGKKKDKEVKSDESDNEIEVKKGKQKGKGRDSKKSDKPKPRGRPKAKGRKDRKTSKEKNDSESEESEKEEKLSREEELALVKKAEDMTYDWASELLKDYIPGIIENSAKMELFFYLLNESIKMGDRILLFSQSLFTLNLIEDFLERNYIPGTNCLWQRNTSYFRLDGSTHALEREKLINEFNANPNIYLFLVSTRAGSLGINLVGANRVIVFDASWNPCHDTQAVCRVYRYGQKKPCFVYRFVMDWCLEKKIYDRQINKQGMADRVVDECNPDAVLSMKEITNLCFDNDEKESAPKDLSDYKDKYIDVLMQGIITKLSNRLSKEPFQHESLLVDRKEKKLSSAEKRLAQRGYELEKKAALAPKPTTAYRTVRGADGSLIQRPVGTVRPMQHGARWIPADVWRRQGMTAQEMTLPLDVVIPTNSSEKTNIVLKAGQRVMVLKSPKGIYMQLESGKIIAIKTSFKGLGQKGADNKDSPVGKKVMPNRPNIPGSLKNNSAITITSKSGPRYQRIIRPNMSQKISRPMIPGQKMSDIRNRINEMRSYSAMRKGPIGPGRLRPVLPGSVSITKIPRDVKKSDNDSDSNAKSKNDDSEDETQVLDSDDEATDTDARDKERKNESKDKTANNEESSNSGSGSNQNKTDKKPQDESESLKQESPEPIVLTTDEKLPSEEALEKSAENNEPRTFSRVKIESASMSPGERVERKINLLKNYRHQRPVGVRAPNESSLSQLEKTASVLNKESMPDFRRNLDDITQSYSPTGEEKPATKSRKKKPPTKVEVESQERQQSSMSHSVSSLLGQGSKPHRSEVVPSVPVSPVGSQPRVPNQLLESPMNAMHSHGHMAKVMPPISGVVPTEMPKVPMPHAGIPVPPGQGYPAIAAPDGYPQYPGYGMGYGAYPPAPYHYPGYGPGYYPPPYGAAPPAAAPPPEGYLPPNPQW